jgi:hypothetical protein
MYRLEPTGIWISGGFFSKLIPYEKITGIRTMSRWQGILASFDLLKPPITSFYLGNRPNYFVLIETKWARHMVSGDYPDQFVADVQKRLLQRQSEIKT